MLERLKILVKQWHDLNEIEKMTDEDLADLGMTRNQLRRFAQMPADIAERVVHMGAVFGLSEADLKKDYPAYVELLDTCGTCSHRGECNHLLAQGAAAQSKDCAFCLNARAFAEAAA